MSKRTRNEENSDTKKRRHCSPGSGFSKINDDHTSQFETCCPSRESMFSHLLEGDIKTFKILAPMYVLQMDKDAQENTFLHRLVLKCSETGYETVEKMLKMILRDAVDLTSKRNADTETPLMLACTKADSSELIVQLAEGSPVTTQFEDHNGSIPLLKFISHVKVGRKAGEMSGQKCCHTIETLLKHGENVNHEDQDKNNALNYLLKREDLLSETINDIAKVLFKNGAKLVSETGKHAFKYVVALNEDLISIISQYCHSELFKKCSNKWSVINYLFRDINRNRNFNNPKLNAIDKLLNAMKIIFKNTKSIEDGDTLISCAAKRRIDYRVIHFLISKTPNFKISNNCHSTLLAQYATNEKIVDELLHYGADPNALESYNRTALCTAAEAENTKVIMKLLEAGADPLVVLKSDMCVNNSESFTCYITEGESLDLLKHVLDNPQLKNAKNPEHVSKFYSFLITNIFNNFHYDDKMAIEKLKLVLSKSKSENINLLIDVYSDRFDSPYPKDKKYVQEPIGTLFANSDWSSFLTANTDGQELFLNKLYIFVDTMLDNGLKASIWPKNVVTPLAVLLDSLCEYQAEVNIDSELLPLIDLLIEKGEVDVGSTELQVFHNACSKFESRYQYGKELMIPDVLAIAIDYLTVNIIKKLISYWWGPPIALTSMLRKLLFFHGRLQIQSRPYLTKEIYPLLLKYGDLPNGTSLISKSVWEGVKMWHFETRKQEDEDGDFISEFASPASLQVLCKYAVRHTLAEKASRTGTNLLKLLQQEIPPLLKPFVIH